MRDAGLRVAASNEAAYRTLRAGGAMMHIADQAVVAWTGLRPGATQALGEPISFGQVIPLPSSRFELSAAQNKVLPPHLIPLWAEEGMHRAHCMLSLLDRWAEHDRGAVKSRLTAGVECALAHSLASAYRALATAREDAIVPCSALLRDVVLNLGALFGGGSAVVRTVIERLNVPAYKRRALVLCASELMINALTHAFRNASPDGRIEVSLRQIDDERACLRVADNGAGFGQRRPNTAVSIAGALADLLEADLTYPRTADWTTTAAIISRSTIRPHGRRDTGLTDPW